MNVHVVSHHLEQVRIDAAGASRIWIPLDQQPDVCIHKGGTIEISSFSMLYDCSDRPVRGRAAIFTYAIAINSFGTRASVVRAIR
eukprot:2959521-Rhodomonas_salina.2